MEHILGDENRTSKQTLTNQINQVIDLEGNLN